MMENDEVIENIRNRFVDIFQDEPVIVRAPGRVNIIGEHTDYNEGFVLPAAIDRVIVAAAGSRDDNEIHLHSYDFNEVYTTSLERMRKEDASWTNYVLGVVDQLVKARRPPGGFNLVIGGNIPIGAGLSSSAAMECSVIHALNALFDLSLSSMEMVRMAQMAEHVFAGVKCGIMDQFASTFGKKEHAIRLDCRSLEYEYVPLDLQGHKIVLLNTNVRHSLASSEYNSRRQECEQGVRWVKEKFPEVSSLRDVNAAMLEECVAKKDVMVFRRCLYVVEENQRLLRACDFLQAGDIEGLGQMMFQSHDGLSRDYEVSCPELDLLVEAVRENPAVPGARMMGGGFGGCTINLMRTDSIPQLTTELSESYERKTGLKLDVYVAEVDEGASLARVRKEA